MDDIIQTKKNIKKCETTVSISGLGVIVFGFWAVLKLVISLIYGEGRVTDLVGEMALDDEQEPVTTIIIIAIIFLILIAFHVYVGLRAIRYARGPKRKILFLVVVAFMIFFTIIGLPSYFISDETGTFDISALQDETIAAALVDVALIYMLIDLMVSAIRLKVLDKRLKEQEA